MNSIVNGATVYKTGSSDSSEASSVYPSLQDAIADANNIAVGDIFQTNGFNSNNDGGAARYLVTDSGTANGMDIVSLGPGKLAVLQFIQEAAPEQIGYSYGIDVVPYISRLISIGVVRIRLILKYTWKTTLTLTTRGIDFVGNSPFTLPASSLINVNLNAGVTCAVALRAQNIRFENLYFYNAKGNPGDETAVECDWIDDSANNYKITFRRVRFVSFHRGVYFHGRLPWHITFDDVVLGWCDYGVEFSANSSILYFRDVHTSGCYICGIDIKGATQGVTFEQCNFGSYGNAIHFEKLGQHLNQEDAFVGCNFELDKLDIDPDTKNVFIEVDNGIRVALNFSACNFVITKNSMLTIPAGMRFIQLGDATTLKMSACIIEDDLAGDIHLDRLIDEQRPPLNEVGAISVDSTTFGFVVPNFGINYRGCVVTSKESYNNSIDVSTYAGATLSDYAAADCDDVVPSTYGAEITAEVNSFSGTANMPTGVTGFGILHSALLVNGTRCIQYMMCGNGTVHLRRAIRNTLSDPWTWDPWT